MVNSLKEKENIEIIECFIKYNINVKESFIKLVEKIIKLQALKEDNENAKYTILNDRSIKKKKGKCIGKK